MFAPPPEEQLSNELKEESKSVSKSAPSEPVNITVEERLNLELSRDGAVHSSELTGVLFVLIKDEQFCKIKLVIDCEDSENVQMQVKFLR